MRTACAARLLPLLLLLTLPAPVQAQYNYSTDNGTITITRYNCFDGAVTIPSTINGLPVTSIGEGAFQLCDSLTSVTIPDSVTSIGIFAFEQCTSLTSVTIGNSVTSIGNQAFLGCTSLTSVTIPNSVTSIGFQTFSGCTSLSAIMVETLNTSYTSIDGVLFNKSRTTLIDYPGGKAESYQIPNGVTSIGNQAFSGCTRLTSVTIPNSVTSIGGEFGVSALRGCTSLRAITVEALNPSYSSIDGVLFDRTQTTLIQYPIGKTGSYQIPNSVTSIRGVAFGDCTSLTSVTIPNSVTNIAFGTFSGCTSLSSVTIGNSVTSIGDQAFYGCTHLTSVMIPDSVTNIGVGAFGGCDSLTSVTIGNSVTSIGVAAFQGCDSLTGVYFKANAPSIESSVFVRAHKAIVYYLPGTTGWDSMFGGRPAALWKPMVQTSGSSFGVRTNQFGFTITWASDRVIVVEASTDLVNPVWYPLQTNTLAGDLSYFSDPQWTNHRSRFYRLRSQ